MNFNFWEVKKYFLYFLAYSVIGWIYEVFLETVVYRWGFSDRGVLFGPYCPIYGFGAIIIILLFGKLVEDKSKNKFIKLLVTFLGIMFVATLIELLTSYILEAFTGSWPWQTYLDYTYNFQGRIALSPSIRFGLGGVLFLYILQPFFKNIVSKFSLKTLNRTFFVSSGVMGLDFLVYLINIF